MNTADIVNAWQAQQAAALDAADELSPLTPREREALILLCKGQDHREVARAIGVSQKTVGNMAMRIRQKTDLSIIEAAVLATRAGWV